MHWMLRGRFWNIPQTVQMFACRGLQLLYLQAAFLLGGAVPRAQSRGLRAVPHSTGAQAARPRPRACGRVACRNVTESRIMKTAVRPVPLNLNRPLLV